MRRLAGARHHARARRGPGTEAKSSVQVPDRPHTSASRDRGSPGAVWVGNRSPSSIRKARETDDVTYAERDGKTERRRSTRSSLHFPAAQAYDCASGEHVSHDRNGYILTGQELQSGRGGSRGSAGSSTRPVFSRSRRAGSGFSRAGAYVPVRPRLGQACRRRRRVRGRWLPRSPSPAGPFFSQSSGQLSSLLRLRPRRGTRD
jgi:hypothetical protein